MRQWPFAHEYEMTYILSNGELEVRIAVTNLSAEPMPLAIGFHPYFRIPDAPRNDWVGRIPAGRRVVTDARLIPTGQYKPMDLADPFLLENRTLDDGFVDLDRDPDGRARFYIASSGKTVEVLFGPKWQAAIVWEPNDGKGQPQEFICFEPMAGITNAVNLNHDGKYPELQSVPAGGTWTESFWVRTTGLLTDRNNYQASDGDSVYSGPRERYLQGLSGTLRATSIPSCHLRRPSPMPPVSRGSIFHEPFAVATGSSLAGYARGRRLNASR